MLWGLVRPQRGVTKVTIEHRPKGEAWRVLKTLDTTAAGVYALKTTHRSGQRYRVKLDRARRPDVHRAAGSGLLVGSGPDLPALGS